jgi:hypothetical protein
MTPVGFEPAVPASDGQQTYDLDRAATGISSPSCIHSHEGTQLNNQQNNKTHFIHEILQSQIYMNWLSERSHLL